MDLREIIIDSSIKHMNQIMQALTSKTVWTFVLIFASAGFQAVSQYFSTGTFVAIIGILGAFGTYFKVNPSQPYGPNQG